jgi:hypothetical protein
VSLLAVIRDNANTSGATAGVDLCRKRCCLAMFITSESIVQTVQALADASGSNQNASIHWQWPVAHKSKWRNFKTHASGTIHSALFFALTGATH